MGIDERLNEKLNGYKIVEEIPIRWGDMDARGHVNNTIYFRYFETARLTLFHSLDVYEEFETTGIGPILAYADCKFKAPLTYPDTIYVGAKITSIEGSKIIIKHILVSKKLNNDAAEGEAHMVWYNYKERKRVIIPDTFKQKLKK